MLKETRLYLGIFAEEGRLEEDGVIGSSFTMGISRRLRRLAAILREWGPGDLNSEGEDGGRIGSVNLAFAQKRVVIPSIGRNEKDIYPLQAVSIGCSLE